MMSGILLTAGALVALGLFYALLVYVPFNRWQFEFEGRSFEVSNYVTRETVTVDGVLVERTRVAGDHATWATHAIALPDGRTLEIKIFADNHVIPQCEARVADELVFNSKDDKTWVATATLPGAPEAATSATSRASITDERWTAAQILLDELASGDPQVVEAASTLRRVLVARFGALAAARRALEAHRALGSTLDDLDDVVTLREAAVAEGLEVLRELHAASVARSSDVADLPRVEQLVDELRAEREVDEATRKRAAARRVQGQAESS